MTHAAFVSFKQVREQIIHPDYPHMCPLNKKLITSLAERLGVLQDSSQKSSKEIASLENHIRNGAYKAEDRIESHITDQGPLQSTSQGIISLYSAET